MELEAGSVGVDVWGSRGRRRVNGVGRWVLWTARGIAVHGQGFARRRWTHDPRHVSDHVDEDAGHGEGEWRS